MTDSVNDGPTAPNTADAGTAAIMRILDLAEELAPLTGASHRDATRYAAQLYANGILGSTDEMARDEARDMLTIPSYLEAMADIVHRQAAERAEYDAHIADVIPLGSRRRSSTREGVNR